MKRILLDEIPSKQISFLIHYITVGLLPPKPWPLKAHTDVDIRYATTWPCQRIDDGSLIDYSHRKDKERGGKEGEQMVESTESRSHTYDNGKGTALKVLSKGLSK